jgi:formylglycine-generating enzyme required for sulfatase activity
MDVFISYKREERPRCQYLASRLEELLGLKVWFDASLEPGLPFPREIEEQVRAAKAVLVLWSPLSIKSDWVPQEARIGRERKVLVSVKIAPCTPPLPFLNDHAEELFDAAFADDDPAWLKIAGRIGSLCGRKDIEEWSRLPPNATAAQLNRWLDTHRKDSPLRATVLHRWQARRDEDEARERRERQARWKWASENINTNSSQSIQKVLKDNPDHPDAGRWRRLLPSVEAAERKVAAQAAYENLDKRSSSAIQKFLQDWPDHPGAPALRLSLPAVEAAERTKSEREKQRTKSSPVTPRHKRDNVLLVFVALTVIAIGLIALQSNQQPQVAREAESLPPVMNDVAADQMPVEVGDNAVSQWPAGAEFRDCEICPLLVVIPSGEFTMGSPEDEVELRDHREEERRVRVREFAIGKFEVTFAEWDACVDAGGCSYSPDDEGWGRGNRPVIDVHLSDVDEYLSWLSQQTGHQYRLPTEAEWEYAARGGDRNGAYWWGAFASRDYANYGLGRGSGEIGPGVARGADQWVNTAPVGRFPANPFGLYDMHGNVAERAQNCWRNVVRGEGSPGEACDPGSRREIRGGSWRSPPDEIRSANLDDADSTQRRYDVGLRVVRTVRQGEIPPRLELAHRVETRNEDQREVAPTPQPTLRSRVQTIRDCPECPEMVSIPNRPFLIGQYEVTFGQWDACVAAGGCNGYRPRYDGSGRRNQPVFNVNWHEAQAYVQWLSQRTSRRYRLPTAAEWEFAARGGTTTNYSWGDDEPICDPRAPNGASFNGCRNAGTRLVGSFQPNAFGLHDVHGNVSEWVEDCDGFNCSQRTLRGGSWGSQPVSFSFDRGRSYPGLRNSNHGFRVAREP